MNNNGKIQNKKIRLASIIVFFRLSIFLPFLNNDKKMINPNEEDKINAGISNRLCGINSDSVLIIPSSIVEATRL